MEKLEFPETQRELMRTFEMRGSFMDSGGKDRISDGDIIHGLPVPGIHWTIDFLGSYRIMWFAAAAASRFARYAATTPKRAASECIA